MEEIDIFRTKLTKLSPETPREVASISITENPKLNTLENCPEIVHGNFSLDSSAITSLKYCPRIVEGNFVFQDNKKFTTPRVRKVQPFRVVI